MYIVYELLVAVGLEWNFQDKLHKFTELTKFKLW